MPFYTGSGPTVKYLASENNFIEPCSLYSNSDTFLEKPV